MAECLQVTVTVGDEAEADAISAALVERRLAACVQTLGPIRSRYRWQGAIEQSQEWLLLVKTTDARYGELEAAVRDLHSYDEPEIVATRLTAGSAGYLAWVAESVERG
jgi:periplasmic divalent cation tolerance protein